MTLRPAGVLPKAAQQAMQQDSMLQAANGLKAMHDTGMVHNDVKAVNFLVDADGVITVSDFGSSEWSDGSRRVFKETTEIFAAPGYLRGKGKNRTKKSDIHALGAYLQVVGREVSDIKDRIDALNGKLLTADKIGAEEASIAAPNNRPVLAKLVADIKKAGEPFGQADGDEEENAWDFAYRRNRVVIDAIANPGPLAQADLAGRSGTGRAAARPRRGRGGEPDPGDLIPAT